MILENGSFEAILGMEQDGLAKASAEVAVLSLEMTGGAQGGKRPILAPFLGQGLHLKESQGTLEIPL